MRNCPVTHLPDCAAAAAVVEGVVAVGGLALGVDVVGVGGSEVRALAGGWLAVDGAPAADIKHQENTNNVDITAMKYRNY